VPDHDSSPAAVPKASNKSRPAHKAEPDEDTLRRRKVSRAFIGGELAVLLIVIVAGLVVERYEEPAGCPDPVELTVLVPVDGAAGYQAAVDEFNRVNVDADGCREANVTAYSAPWPDVEQAMAHGWAAVPEGGEEDAAPFAPLRDVGPRPHLWIAESRTQVDLAADRLDDSAIQSEVFAPGDAVPLGRTPLVLAVPDAVLEAGFNGGAPTTDQPLPELITELGQDYGTPVLRSDPTAVASSLLFFRALYGSASAPVLENQLADAAAELGIALAPSDTDLLCDVTRTQGGNPYAAVLTTEAALARYNTGQSLGDGCALTDDARSGLVPVYGGHFGALDYQAVRLDWGDDPWADERAAVADELRDWLTGTWNPMDMGVRSEDYAGEEIKGDNGFDTEFAVTADPVGADEFTALQDVYGQIRPPTTVLLAIDHSGTMDEPVGGGRTRFQLATDGVVTALDYLGVNAADKAALWTFPVAGSASHAEVFGMTTDPGDDVADQLAATQTSNGVDLHQTVVDGLAELEGAGDDEGSSAMVVLTDGADVDRSATTAAAVRTALADTRASLYLIAVGEASCRSATFADLAADPRVTCLEADEQQITATFDSLFNQLWSGR
jgi:hypothetical protein